LVLVPLSLRLFELVVPVGGLGGAGGRIVWGGGRELALALARRGYDWVQDGTAAA
jgi:hypothetical protein